MAQLIAVDRLYEYLAAPARYASSLPGNPGHPFVPLQRARVQRDGSRSLLLHSDERPGVGPPREEVDMTRMTTEEAFVKVLQRHGIEHAFGIIGSAMMPVSDLFPKAGITFWDLSLIHI